MTEGQPFQRLNIFSNVESRTTHFINWLYSGTYCAIAFVVLHYLGYLTSYFNAHYLGFEPSVSYEGLSSLRETTGWGPARIAFVYLAPAAIGMGVFIIATIGAYRISPLRTHLKNLLFWFSFNGYLQFYSYFIFGLIGVKYKLTRFYGSYAAVFDWLYWSKENCYVVLSAFAVLFLLGALILTPLIVSFNHSQSITLLKGFDRVILTNILIVPFSLGSMLVFASSFPMDTSFQAVRMLSAIPLALACYFSMRFIAVGNILIVKGGMRKLPIYGVLGLMLLLIVVTRIFFSIRLGDN